MSHTFKLHGDYSVVPASGNPSAAPTVSAPIDETLTLKRSPSVSEYELASDAVQAVAFGPATNAHVIVIKTVGGKVKARLTSADGAVQSVAVDSFALIISESVPYTALDLTRVSGVTTTVKVLLGEKA
jgi:hypothetical protein